MSTAGLAGAAEAVLVAMLTRLPGLWAGHRPVTTVAGLRRYHNLNTGHGIALALGSGANLIPTMKPPTPNPRPYLNATMATSEHHRPGRHEGPREPNMTTIAISDGPGDVPLGAVEAEEAEIARRYREAIEVFLLHHDQPGTVTEDDLAAALRPYLQRWDRRMRQKAYRYGFTTDDVGIVTQTASTEFFFEKILPGQFNPAKNEFSIFQTLIIQRAIDHQRRRQTKKENLNIEGLNRPRSTDSTVPDDPYAGASPTPSAEDIAMESMTLEEAAKKLCAGAGLDARETSIITYRYVHEITDWPAATELINAELPPPITWKTLRNICRTARKKIQTHLDTRPREEDRS